MMPQIEVSTDYSKFKLLDRNRDVCQAHIDLLANDESFIARSAYSPLLVDADYNIIDGQHRFHALKSVGKPIYYIRDPHAKDEDVIKRNNQQRNWAPVDIIKFYYSIKPTYKLIQDLSDELSVPHARILHACKSFRMPGGGTFVKIFREGNLEIDPESVDGFKSFCRLHFNQVKRLTASRGRLYTAQLHRESYIRSAIILYSTERDVYDDYMDKLNRYPYDLVYAPDIDRALAECRRIAKSRRKSHVEM